MLTEQRHEKIMQHMQKNKSVTVKELTELLDTSESTIRRDLTQLDKQGKLTKVFGGAVSKDLEYHTKDEDIQQRTDKNKEIKISLARFAASLVTANDFVFLDAGTTTMWFPEYVKNKKAVFVTNSMVHAQKLVQCGIEVHVLGGVFKASTQAIVGDEAIEQLRKYHFTKGFFGTNGMGMDTGFTTPDIREAALKRFAVSRSKEAYIVADSEKFNCISAVEFCAFENATVITDVMPKEYETCHNIIQVKQK